MEAEADCRTQRSGPALQRCRPTSSLSLNQEMGKKLTNNVPVVYMARQVLNGFDAGKIYNEGHWKGWALGIDTFLGSEMATSEANAIWAQNCAI